MIGTNSLQLLTPLYLVPTDADRIYSWQFTPRWQIAAQKNAAQPREWVSSNASGRRVNRSLSRIHRVAFECSAVRGSISTVPPPMTSRQRAAGRFSGRRIRVSPQTSPSGRCVAAPSADRNRPDDHDRRLVARAPCVGDDVSGAIPLDRQRDVVPLIEQRPVVAPEGEDPPEHEHLERAVAGLPQRAVMKSGTASGSARRGPRARRAPPAALCAARNRPGGDCQGRPARDPRARFPGSSPGRQARSP